MAVGITLRLHDASGTPLASETGLTCLWWDETAPASFANPLGRSSVGETDANGDLILDLTNVTALTSGQSGFLMIYRLDGTDHKDSLTFAGQVEVGAITSGVDMYSPGDWVRPSDWLTLPAVSDSEHKVLLLHRVEDGADNYVALSAASDYTVDWGDGSTPENFASGATAQHQYTFADTDLDGTELADGAKQAIITITPQATYSLTSLDLHKANTSAAAGDYASGIMDVVISGPLLTTLYLGRSSASASIRLVNYPWLEQVSLYAPTLTAVTNLFRGLVSLAKLSRFTTGTITDASQLFYNCASLQSLPAGMTLASVTNATNCFYNCASLQSLPAGMTLASVTNVINCFYNCASLQSLPAGMTLGAVTNATNCFQNCASLQSLPAGMTLASVTNATGCFYNCASLQSLPAGMTLGAVTNAANCFYNCASLQSLPAGMTLASVTDATNCFYNCASLQSLPASLTLASATTTTNTFASCSSLQTAPGLAIPVSFSIASCNFAAAALDALYTSLPTVAGQTITVTSNPGTTGDTPSIATAKGWTVSGS